MSEISVTSTKVYSINGLAQEDMVLLSLVLHKTTGDLEQPDLDRASMLVQTVDAVLREEE